MENHLASELLEKGKEPHNIVSIKIEGNSYSLDFCQVFGEILKKAKSLKVFHLLFRISTSTTFLLVGSKMKFQNQLNS